MPTGWLVGVDWKGKGFPCAQYSLSTGVNDLGDWIPEHWDYTNILDNYPAIPTVDGPVPIAPMPFGRDAFRFAFSSSSQWHIFTDDATYPITTVNAHYYRVVFWYRMIEQDTSGGANVVTPYLVRSNGATVVDTGAALGQSTSWTQASMQYQQGALGIKNVILRFAKNAALSSITYEFSGLMIIDDVITIPVPGGYASGDPLDTYDELVVQPDVKFLEFEGGLKPYEVAAGEKKAQVLLDNTDRRYSPDYASSPIYGYMKPGRVVVIYDTSTGVVRHQYTGYLDTLTADPGKAASQSAKLTTTNLVSILNRSPISLAQQEGKDIAALMLTELLLYDERLATLAYLNDTMNSQFTADYYGDNSQGEDGTGMSMWTAFAELAEAEQGKLYINKQGIPHLRYREWDLSSAANPANATYSNVGKLTYAPSAARIVTRLSVKVYPRQIGASATTTLWTLRSNIIIPAGKTRTFRCKYRDSRVPCGAKDVATPTGADYVTAGGSPSLTFTPGADDAVVTIDNTAGGTDCTVSVLVIKGRTIKTDDPGELVYQNDYLVETYGYHDMRLDLKAFSDIEDAQDLIDFIFPTLSLDRGEITSIQIVTEDNGTDNQTQLSLDVASQLSITDTQLGLTSQFYNVVGWKHQVDPKSRSHITTLYLEVAIKQTFWQIGVSRLGLETRLGR